MLVQPATASFRVKRTPDVHIHARSLEAWDQHYEQVSPGAFVGEVHELRDQNFQLFHEVASCATSQRCRPWRGGVWMGLAVTEADAGLRFLGNHTDGRHLMLASDERPFDLQVPAGVGLYGLVLDKARLVQHMQALRHHPGAEHWMDEPQVQVLSALQRYRLAGLMREVLRGLQSQPDVLNHEASRRSLHETLLTVLTDIVVPEVPGERVGARHQRRHDLVHRVREMVHECPEQPLNVSDLCVRLHVTRRTLQNAFQGAIGMSPATFLRTVRLNGVRRALRDPSTVATIAETAARWGFWHMGHFCQEYKALFGQTPSQSRTVHTTEATRVGSSDDPVQFRI